MTLVKNLKEGNRNAPPTGYSSWKAWWEEQKGREFSDCSCSGCTDDATDGSHVIKVNSNDKKWYIVPLCHPCNEQTRDFYVRDADLEPINP